MSTLKVDTIDTSNSSGNITVSRPLSGSGASLTALNATQLTSGTIPIARIADDAVTNAKMANDAIDSAQIADNAVTLAKMAGGTDGQVITYDASGDPVAVGPGTDGQVLTSTGAGSPPAFEDVGSSYSLIHNSTTAAAARAFTGMSRTTYTMGWWIYFNTVYPSTAGDIELLVSGNDGSSYHGAYTFAMGGHDWDGTAINRNITSAGSEIKLNIGTVWNIAPAGMSGWIFIPQSLGSANVGIVWSMGSMENSSADKERYIGFGACDNAVVDINAFKIETSNGSNVNGHIQVYGLKPS